MEGKFDKTLIAAVRKGLFAVSLRKATSEEVSENILSSLSETHAIVPKEEYERLHKVLRAAAIARTQGTLHKTCVTLSRKDFARLEVAVVDWEVHAGLGYSAKDLEEASSHA